VVLPASLTSSPLAAALNPTIAEEDIQTAMFDTEETDVEQNSEEEGELENSESEIR
jgi:hypothetical protein